MKKALALSAFNDSEGPSTQCPIVKDSRPEYHHEYGCLDPPRVIQVQPSWAHDPSPGAQGQTMTRTPHHGLTWTPKVCDTRAPQTF